MRWFRRAPRPPEPIDGRVYAALSGVAVDQAPRPVGEPVSPSTWTAIGLGESPAEATSSAEVIDHGWDTPVDLAPSPADADPGLRADAAIDEVELGLDLRANAALHDGAEHSVSERSGAPEAVPTSLPRAYEDVFARRVVTESDIAGLQRILDELAVTAQSFRSAFVTDGEGIVCSAGVDAELAEDFDLVSGILLNDCLIAHRVLHGTDMADTLSLGSTQGGQTVVVRIRHPRTTVALWVSARAVTLGVLLARANMAVEQVHAVLDGEKG